MTIIRYLRLYLCFVRFSFSKAFEFRIDFLIHVCMEIFYAGTIVLFYEALFAHIPTIGGWNIAQVRLLYSAWIMVDALQTLFVSQNIESLPELVNRGELDYYLTRPVSSLFFVSARELFSPAIFDVLISGGILGWALYSYPEPLSLLKICLFLLLVFNGFLIYFMIRFMLLIFVFWTQSAEGLHTLFFSVHRFGERPDGIFHGWTRRFFTIALPFCLIASFPTRFLTTPFDPSLLLHIFLVTLLFGWILIKFWQRGLRAYSSASS